MHKPVILSRSPSKSNIFYDVLEKDKEIEVALHFLVDELHQFYTRTTKTIIFCRSYNDCGRLYQYFKSEMKNKMTGPIGYPDVTQFRLVDMFTASNSVEVKNSILQSFTRTKGRLRILIATVAFGMGIDCPTYVVSFIGVHHLILKNIFKRLGELAVMVCHVMQLSFTHVGTSATHIQIQVLLITARTKQHVVGNVYFQNLTTIHLINLKL